MKKILAISICIFLIIISVLNVGAAKRDPDSSFVIDELGISLYVPMHYVATRTSNNFDMEPEKFEETVKDFEQHDIYLWGGSKFYNEEIYVHANDTNVKSLAHFNEEGLEEVTDNIKENLKANGCIISKSEIYESYNATYILTHYSDTEENYAISYSTVENYKDIVLTMWSYGSEPTATQRKDFLSIINTIEFDIDNEIDETTPTETEGIANDIRFYENTVVFELANEGKLTAFGITILVIVASIILTLIAGAIVTIILITKAKKRRRLAAQKAAEAEATVNTRYCINCGTQIPADDIFCYNCGKAQTTDEESKNPENIN